MNSIYGFGRADLQYTVNLKRRLRAVLGAYVLPNVSIPSYLLITWINQHTVQQVEGVVNGRMATEESGNGGFGYDALFIPDGYDATFAVLPAETKNTISHRARALHALRELLLN